MTPPASTPRRMLLALGLFASGLAALLNQVVWQASLKRFVGGSDALASMIVVLVFMAGLGFGSIGAARLAASLARPLRVLGLVEVGLALANLAIRWLFGSDLVATLTRAQVAASQLGIPLLLVQGITATLLLLAPCFLMGTTTPLASEAAQRELGLRDSRVLAVILGLNTLGSVLGAVLGTGVLVPRLGYLDSLLVAVALNLAAALAFAAAAGPAAPSRSGGGAPLRLAPSADDALGFGLGFCSLAYEMLLLRLLPLVHGPSPFTFGAVVAGFLLWWSAGAALGARVAPRLPGVVASNGLAVLLSAVFFVAIDLPSPLVDTPSMLRFVATHPLYFLPCLLSGLAFALLATRAQSWGSDVGRLCAYNTLGACAGAVITTLFGYEIHVLALPTMLCLLLLGLAAVGSGRGPLLAGLAAAGAAAVGALAGRLPWPTLTMFSTPMVEVYFDRNGVVGIDALGNMSWDGLRHSRLAVGQDYRGNVNWRLAAGPVLAHDAPVRRACVIGMGTGVTAGVLDQLSSLERVDVYEFNRALDRLLLDHPEGTLRVRESPRVRILWEDVRAGLVLRDDRYDVITSQPLYLHQAGSSLLNSVEFFRLVSSRLAPGGVFCLYSRGSAGQAYVMRQTAARVFPHAESTFGGYLLLLSRDPIDLSLPALERRYAAAPDDAFWRSVRGHPRTATARDAVTILDAPRLPWGDGSLVVTEDRPLIEYPLLLDERLARHLDLKTLPQPH